VEVSLSPLETEEGVLISGVIRDITDRKRAEEKIRQSEAELRQLVDVIPQQVFVFDPDWNPLFANRRELEYTGLTPQEAQSGDSVARIFHPEDLKKLEAARERARSDGAPIEMEVRIRGKTGGYRWFLLRDHPLRDDQGRILRWYGTRTDIEERKRVEQERERLRELEAELAHINRVSMMGELAGSLGHEIKQPIAGAVTNASTCLRWLQREQPDLTEACAAATRMVEDALRAVDIIDRMNSLNKKAAPQREPVNVNEVIREIVALLRSEAARHSISIRTELGDDIPKVIGDRVQLQQVLMNLMINGIDATKGVDGVREIALASRSSGTDGLIVSVSDTGIGLPPEVNQIFDPFFTTKAHGTGMGLAISRSIIESHGGRLSAGSNAGHGATFSFTLPAAIGIPA